MSMLARHPVRGTVYNQLEPQPPAAQAEAEPTEAWWASWCTHHRPEVDVRIKRTADGERRDERADRNRMERPLSAPDRRCMCVELRRPTTAPWSLTADAVRRVRAACGERAVLPPLPPLPTIAEGAGGVGGEGGESPMIVTKEFVGHVKDHMAGLEALLAELLATPDLSEMLALQSDGLEDRVQELRRARREDEDESHLELEARRTKMQALLNKVVDELRCRNGLVVQFSKDFTLLTSSNTAMYYLGTA